MKGKNGGAALREMKDRDGVVIDYGFWALTRFLALDPGMNTGWAIFEVDSWPTESGVIRAPEKWTDTRRLLYIRDGVMDLILQLRPEATAIEDAEYRGTPTGRASAASGALTLLSNAVGGLVFVCPLPSLIPANQWKGQMGAEAVQLRINKALGTDIDPLPEHAREAWGLGLAVRGLL